MSGSHREVPVPANSPSVFKPTPLRLLAQCFKPLRPPGEGQSPSVEEILSAISLKVLEEGYLILLKTKSGGTPLPLSRASVILARTTTEGEIVTIRESEIDGPVPEGGDRVRHFDPGDTYACFWTWKDRGDLLRKVLAHVREDPTRARRDTPMFHFQVQPAVHLEGHARQFMDFVGAHLKPKDAAIAGLLFHDAEGMHGHQIIHGVVTGSEIRWGAEPVRPAEGAQGVLAAPKGQEDDGDPLKALGRLVTGAGALQPDKAYVIARSDPLAALYTALLLLRAPEEPLELSAESWAVFAGAEDVCRQAELDRPAPDLEAAHGSSGATGGPPKIAEAYRHYAFECAWKGQDREVFRTSIDPRVTSATTGAIKKIGRAGIGNPAMGEHRAHKLTGAEVDRALAYYDFYAFGRDNKKAAWRSAFAADQKVTTNAVGRLHVRIGRFLHERARADVFLAALDAHHPRDPGEKAALHRERLTLCDRYFDCAVRTEYKWWDDLPLPSEAKWKKLDTYLDWTGTYTDKLGVLLGRHFGPESAFAYNIMLKQSTRELQALIGKLASGQATLGGPMVMSKLPDGGIVEMDFDSRSIVVQPPAGQSGAAQKIGPLYFDERLAQNAGKARSIYKEKLPFRFADGVPYFLAAFSDVLSLALSVKAIGDAGRRDGVELLGKITMNSVKSIVSVHDAIHFVYSSPIKPSWVLECLRGAGTLLEAYYAVKTGMILLFDGQDGEILRALEKGDMARAVALEVKGLVLVSSVAPGAAAFFAGGLSLGLALSPLGIGLAIGALVVLVIDAALCAQNGPPNAMDAVEQALEDALKKEGFD